MQNVRVKRASFLSRKTADLQLILLPSFGYVSMFKHVRERSARRIVDRFSGYLTLTVVEFELFLFY